MSKKQRGNGHNDWEMVTNNLTMRKNFAINLSLNFCATSTDDDKVIIANLAEMHLLNIK